MREKPIRFTIEELKFLKQKHKKKLKDYYDLKKIKEDIKFLLKDE